MGTTPMGIGASPPVPPDVSGQMGAGPGMMPNNSGGMCSGMVSQTSRLQIPSWAFLQGETPPGKFHAAPHMPRVLTQPAARLARPFDQSQVPEIGAAAVAEAELLGSREPLAAH